MTLPGRKKAVSREDLFEKLIVSRPSRLPLRLLPSRIWISGLAFPALRNVMALIDSAFDGAVTVWAYGPPHQSPSNPM